VRAENLARNLRLVDRLQEISDSLECTPAQLALAWVLGAGVYAIPSGARLSHVKENLGARAIDLDPRTRATLDLLFSTESVAGARKGASGMALVDA
jgi:aryl-alcohol dehydrogenase-like predicted oxidoreductase